MNFHTEVPEPMSVPRCLPLSIGPPVMSSAGRSTDAAPIRYAGVVLSQPASSTTPSSGFERSVSSRSIAMRLRSSIAVGRTSGSPAEVVGNSNGTPPACQMPRLTCSASARRWMLQLVSSLQELAMPMIGRPRNESSGRPSLRNQDRCMNPVLPSAPNHCWLRSP